MRVVLGADHRGYHLKDALGARLRALGHEVADFGTGAEVSIDYPDYGIRVAELKSGKLRAEGVKEGFIITQINNKPVYTIDDLEKIIKDTEGGVYIEGIYPNGVIQYYAFGLK